MSEIVHGPVHAQTICACCVAEGLLAGQAIASILLCIVLCNCGFTVQKQIKTVLWHHPIYLAGQYFAQPQPAHPQCLAAQ